MNATDTTTASTAREGSPTMDTTVTAETIEAPVQLAKTPPRRRGFVYEPMTAAVPASRLTLTEDGHAADPGQLLGLLVDADARNASSGLTFLAEHTAAADLAPSAAAKPEPITRVEIATATLSEGTGCVYKQYGALLRVAYDPAAYTLAKVTELVSTFVGPDAAALIGAGPADTAGLDCADLASVRAHLDHVAHGIAHSARLAADPRLTDPDDRITPPDADDWFRFMHESEVMDAASSDGLGGDVGIPRDAFHLRRLVALVQSYAKMWGSGHGRTPSGEYAAQLGSAIDHLTAERARVLAANGGAR